MPGNVALVFIFNHRYDKNIGILEEIYQARFSHIYHLVPFYQGSKANVIPVFANSFFFQGYIAQGLQSYFREQFEHYLFVGDDLLLNPAINENNYQEYFKLSTGSSFIPEIFTLDKLSNDETLWFEKFSALPGKKPRRYWWRVKDAVEYRHWKAGVETSRELPAYEEAEAKVKKHGYSISPLNFSDLYGGLFPVSLTKTRELKRAAKFLLGLRLYKKHYHLSYPIVGSYSDIVIVSRASIQQFAHYCGVFAANELFVEFAIPTALLLASEHVVTEPEIGRRGEIYWTYTPREAEAYENEMKKYHYRLDELLKRFPQDKLYIHPIKLSRWTKEKI